MCEAIQPVYLSKEKIAALDDDTKDQIAINNRTWECVCDDNERKTKACRKFMMGVK